MLLFARLAPLGPMVPGVVRRDVREFASMRIEHSYGLRACMVDDRSARGSARGARAMQQAGGWPYCTLIIHTSSWEAACELQPASLCVLGPRRDRV